jgi:hypothetical protein
MFKKLLDALELKYLYFSLRETQTEIKNEKSQHKAMLSELENKEKLINLKIENIEFKSKIYE